MSALQGILHHFTRRTLGILQDTVEIRTPCGELLFSCTRWSEPCARAAARELARTAGIEILREESRVLPFRR